jgi:hypothetical protein
MAQPGNPYGSAWEIVTCAERNQTAIKGLARGDFATRGYPLGRSSLGGARADLEIPTEHRPRRSAVHMNLKVTGLQAAFEKLLK